MYVRTELKAGDACDTVQQGDSLRTIAYSFYGCSIPNNVNKIYYSHQATIGPNPNVLQPGQKLYIPN